MPLSPGAEIDRYRVVGLVGRGGLAEVYLARHVELDVPRAIKLLTRTSGHLLQRAAREAQLQARLSHPNIVPLLDVFRVGESPALVLEFIDGPTLETLLRHYRPGFTQVDALARGLMEGLIYAHAVGLVHRDLKPANILVAASGVGVQARIADFGLARICTVTGEQTPSPRITQIGAMMGTPAYMAPEQYEDAATVDGRADVFGLGAVLYELLTGVMAFPAMDAADCYRAMVTCSWRPVRELAPGAPDRMVRAIEGALRPTPTERISSARELLETWTGQRSGRPTPLPDGPDPIWEAAQISLLQRLAPRVNPLATEADPSSHTRSTPPYMLPVSKDGAERPRARTPTLAPPSAAREPERAPAVADDEPESVPPGRFRPAMPRPTLVAGLLACAILGLGLWAWRAAPAKVAPPPPAPAEAELAQAPTAPSAPPPSAPEPTAEVAPSASQRAGRTSAAAADRTAAAAIAAPPEEAPPPVSKPENVIVSGVSRSYLVASDGRRLSPGRVPPGRYSLSVFFSPGEPTSVMEIEVAEGQTYHIRCEPGLRLCR